MEEYRIAVDDLTSDAVKALLEDHLGEMALHSPAESVHALDLDMLRRPEITFWTIWDRDELVGCGALKGLDSRHAEIKSMRTAPAYRGRGIGDRMLRHILQEADRLGYRRLSLETGSMSAFEPARRLYLKYGFTYCEPFADYIPDPNSVFMTKEL